ncbi:glycosyl hydrolase family 18 protein [Cryptosporangium aurantiacum]|uniref:Spore germination protein YaaH n=1 Tax=Cryptosporangium aurantiacum TaxID=134849 RepID=A0A1M7RML0_9ACTN|nr:glycosyl hydrolase family 18 protein [Cryptosporangium aurantiacum]SHN47567.1 Spore germination protein YaaH [Cryptosporangium aurantiacum]
MAPDRAPRRRWSPVARRRVRLLAVVLGVAILLGPELRPKVGPEIVQGDERVRRTMGAWLPYWNTQAAYRTVLRNADLFEYASPFWYQTRGVTTIRPRRGAGNGDVVSGLRREGLAVLPTVTLGLNTTQWVTAMRPAANRRAHVSTLMRLASRYDGLDLDYESFTKTSDARVANQVRFTFTDIARDLCTRLHAVKKRCTITVMARTRPAPAKFRGPYAAWVYDYPTLLEFTDRLRVMAYHEHGAGSRPGPIAGTTWVRRVVRYATEAADRVGAPRSRVEIALPAYGFDWPLPRGRGKSRTTAQMEALRTRLGAERTWDPVAEEYSFRYVQNGVERVAWYPEARSTQHKLDVIQQAGARYGLWYPGGEDPAVWDDAFRPASTW